MICQIARLSEHSAGPRQDIVLEGSVDGSEGGGQQQDLLHLPAQLLPGELAGEPPLRLPASLLLAPQLPHQLLLPHLHHTQQVGQSFRLQLQLQLCAHLT